MQINAMMTSSEVKRSRSLAKSESSNNSFGKNALTVWEQLTFFAFPRHKVNGNDPGENIYWDSRPSAAIFCIKNTENGAVSKILLRHKFEPESAAAAGANHLC